MLNAAAALEVLAAPLAVAAGRASGAAPGNVLVSPPHLMLLTFSNVIQGCSVLCTAAPLGPEAAVELSRTLPLLTGAGRILLEAARAAGSSRCGSSEPAATAMSALQQLLAVNGCLNSFL